jgi:hypothetical protein
MGAENPASEVALGQARHQGRMRVSILESKTANSSPPSGSGRIRSFDEPWPGGDAIFVAVETPEDLNACQPSGGDQADGAIWAVFRKGRKDFNENDVIRGGIAAGLVDVKVVRFSDTHTASKFVIRKAER